MGGRMPSAPKEARDARPVPRPRKPSNDQADVLVEYATKDDPEALETLGRILSRVL
jgi:hypothetical protein